LAFPEMLVACMFGQKISGHNNSLVLFEGITKFNDVNDFRHVARIWNVCKDGTKYDASQIVRIALLQHSKPGYFRSFLGSVGSGKTNLFSLLFFVVQCK
jgi:hypothetical protein